MKSLAYFSLQLGTALLALTVPALAGLTAPTPEPSTFLLIGAGGAAILILRRLRSKK